ncbi:MAG: threonine/serine exporter family protein [Chthoniobacteraceae bacterium]
MQTEPAKVENEPLDQVAALCLMAGRLLLEFGGNARRVQEGILNIGTAYGCTSVESFCQHAAIMLILRRGDETCMQMGKVGEHGVNLRRSAALQEIVQQIGAGGLSCGAARVKLSELPVATGGYPVWLVCVATGLACCGFGRLLNADWAAFFPTLAGASLGQWLRHDLLVHRRQNPFITWGTVAFVSALITGLGSRWAGSAQVPVAMVSSVLLCVPGVAILNAQVDVLDARPNLAAARALRVLYLLLFMTIGLVLAQWLVLASR